MKNLSAALKDKTLEDLSVTDASGSSNLIEPTKTEIGKILTALTEGKDYKEIKKTIRRTNGESKLGFSYGQIREIDLAREAKVSELTPVVEEEE